MVHTLHSDQNNTINSCQIVGSAAAQHNTLQILLTSFLTLPAPLTHIEAPVTNTFSLIKNQGGLTGEAVGNAWEKKNELCCVTLCLLTD
jgi:hypothetical protein